jgi:hypothetical protein
MYYVSPNQKTLATNLDINRFFAETAAIKNKMLMLTRHYSDLAACTMVGSWGSGGLPRIPIRVVEPGQSQESMEPEKHRHVGDGKIWLHI